jgi:hypothetical protein
MSEVAFGQSIDQPHSLRCGHRTHMLAMPMAMAAAMAAATMAAATLAAATMAAATMAAATMVRASLPHPASHEGPCRAQRTR